MKSKYFLYAIIFIFSYSSGFAQVSKKTETLKVWGNCGMCEETIEKNAKKAGASTADWNEETKLLTVSYNSNTSSSLKIQQAIADAGYDTQDLKGSDKAYNKLHGCCKYDRKVEPVSNATKELAQDHKSCGKGCCK